MKTALSVWVISLLMGVPNVFSVGNEEVELSPGFLSGHKPLEFVLQINKDDSQQIRLKNEGLFSGGSPLLQKESITAGSPPYNRLGLLEIKSAGKRFSGTGVLVGPYHVLTAAHNVNDFELGGWASETTFFVGDSGDKHNEIGIKSTGQICFKNWVNLKDEDYDIALIILEKQIGIERGWLIPTAYPEDTFPIMIANITGYTTVDPRIFTSHAKAGQQKTMWNKSSGVKKLKDQKLQYDSWSPIGDSGGPVWVCNNLKNEFLTLGVHRGPEYGHLTQKNIYNVGIRITPNKLKVIFNILNKY